MEISAAWLLTIFLAIATVTESVTTPLITSKSVSSSSTEFPRIDEIKETTTGSAETTSKRKLMDYARPFTNVKDILMQEIRTLDKDSSDAKVSRLLIT
jgi:hypothetical protein